MIKMMRNNKICDVMCKKIIVAHVDDSIEKVEEIIINNKLSFIPIVDSDGVCFGVVSQSDILKFHNNKRNFKREHAWEICSHSVIESHGGISIPEAAKLLMNNKIHHLVIIEDSIICGVVSSINLLSYFIGHMEAT